MRFRFGCLFHSANICVWHYVMHLTLHWRRGRDLERTVSQRRKTEYCDGYRPSTPIACVGNYWRIRFLGRKHFYLPGASAAHFAANEVNDNRKVPVLLTVIGAGTYDTLRSVLAPAAPRDKMLDALIEVLKGPYNPKPLVIGERFRFYQRYQRTDESTADFIADLCRLSITCDFGEQKITTVHYVTQSCVT